MVDHLWQGHGKRMIPVPRALMKRHVAEGAKKTAEREHTFFCEADIPVFQ